jgi:hypothetical protein
MFCQSGALDPTKSSLKVYIQLYYTKSVDAGNWSNRSLGTVILSNVTVEVYFH